MIKEINTEIVVRTTPQKVWQVLTNFNDYGAWNPFIASLTGKVQQGSKINIKLTPPGAAAMTISPTVLALDPGKEFRWLGRFLFPGIFDGEHRFELIDNQDGTTTFRHSEKFGGLLLPFLQRMLKENTQKGFEQMNMKLKERAEQL